MPAREQPRGDTDEVDRDEPHGTLDRLLVSGLIGLVGLGACSAGTLARARCLVHGDIGDSASSATSATSSAPPASATTAAATTTSAVAYPAADVCTYLAGQIPALTAIGSPVGVQANLAGNLFGFFQSHGIPADGAQLDDATKAQCPDVRSQILVLSGLTSFTQL